MWTRHQSHSIRNKPIYRIVELFFNLLLLCQQKCIGPSTGPPKPQQLFRLPHDPRELFDSVVPPETIMQNQPDGPISFPFDGRAGDNNAQVALQDDEAGGEDEEDFVDFANPTTHLITLAMGGIIICIGGILFRRFFNHGWWDFLFE